MTTDRSELALPAPGRLWAVCVALLTAGTVVQAAAWPFAVRASDARGFVHGWLAWPMWALATASTLAFCGYAIVRRRFEARAAWALCWSTGATLLVGGLATLPGAGASYAHPTYAVALAAGAALGATLPWRQMLVASATTVAGYLVGIVPTLFLGAAALAPTLANVAQMVAVQAVATVTFPALFALSRQQQLTRTELASARAAVTSQQAREQERARQYRLVHDTVLSSLTGLSRGSLAPQDPTVRRRLAADADYLRGLIATSDSRAGMFLVGELARIAREFEPTGLRIHPHVDSVPDDLPDDVAQALSQATREALNNVVKHSGKLEAWVTLTGGLPGPDGRPADADAVTMMITDRGRGFDPARTRSGIGRRESLGRRMADVGGACEIYSEPGQGTTVELRWPQ